MKETLLTDEERNAVANGISQEGFGTSSEYFEAIIKAENEAQNAKTKRVIMRGFTVTGGYISGKTKYISLEMPLLKWQEFKELGE